MDKQKDTMDNSSYYYRLNQELSGQAQITPYYVNSEMVNNQNEFAAGENEVQFISSVDEDQ